MAQIKNGTVLAVNGLTRVWASSSALWPGVPSSALLTIGNSGILYLSGGATLYDLGDVAPYSQATPYQVGQLVELSGVYYVSIQASQGVVPNYASAAQWMPVSGWYVELTAPVALPTGVYPYTLNVSFTPRLGLPLPEAGDRNVGLTISRAFQLLDAAVGGTGEADGSVAEHNASLTAHQTLLGSFATRSFVGSQLSQHSSSGEAHPQYLHKTSGVVTRPMIATAMDGSTVTVMGNGVYALRSSTTDNVVVGYSIAGGTYPLVNGEACYLIADYNDGAPILRTSSVEGDWNGLSSVHVATFIRDGASVHTPFAVDQGLGLAEKLYESATRMSHYVSEPGGLKLSAIGRVIYISAGYACLNGARRIECSAVNSTANPFSRWYKSSGYWTNDPVTGFENTWYQDVGGIHELSEGRYAVTHVFIQAGNFQTAHIMLGEGDYTLEEAARCSFPTSLPPLLKQSGVYVGRIIAPKGATTAYMVQSPLGARDLSPVNVHGLLTGVLGDGDRHLSASQLEEIRTLGSTYLSKSATTSDVPEGSRLYYTDARVQSFVSTLTGAANGLMPLDASGKAPLAYMPDALLGQVRLGGRWDAAANNPALPSAATSKGIYYLVSGAGTYDNVEYSVGDWCISDGISWGKVDNSDAVMSFNGRLGTILPIASDYASFYLGLHAQAADSAKLGGQLPSYYAQAGHTHTQESVSSTAGWITNALAGKQPTIAAGTTSQYYRGDKTFQDFATSVRAAVLTGLNTSKLSSREVLSTDSLLSAIGLLQGQLTSIVEQNYYEQSGDTKLEIPLSYTGTGTGVLTLRLLSDIAQTATIDGTGKFYGDSAGTLNESTSFAMSANAWTTFYIKVPSGTCNVTIPNGYAIRAFGDSSSNLVGESVNGPKINGLNTNKLNDHGSSVYIIASQNLSVITGSTRPWLKYKTVLFQGSAISLSGTTYPWLNATQVYFLGNALTVSGVTYPWVNATLVYFLGGAMTLSGVTYPWVNATLVYFNGNALTVSGVTYPWVNAALVLFSGNALTVSGQTYPWLNATTVYFGGNSLTVSGATYPWVNAIRVIFIGNAMTIAANISTSVLYSGAGDFDLFIDGTGMSVTYPTSRSWPVNITRIYIRPSTGSMPSADVDRLFNDLDSTSGLTAVGSKLLDLRGNCGAVTAASATARANLAAKGFTVSFNV